MDAIAIVGLAIFVLAKESGVPLPVPGDLVIIGAGATLYDDLPGAGLVLGVILLAGFVGVTIQYFLFRGALRRPLLSALGRLGVGEERLERLAGKFRDGGFSSVALARATPGVRIGVVPAAAIAEIRYPVFLAGMIIGNGVFVTAHFALGFVLGVYAHDLFLRYGPMVLGVVIVLAVLAVVGWLVLRARRSPAARADTYECWADCSCPVCVALVSRSQPDAAREGGRG